jgi:hypothetical protein
MRILDQIEALPDDGLVTGRFVKAAVADLQREEVTLAAERELTLQMWEDIGTRYISTGAPEWDTNQTPDPGRIASGHEE